MKIGYPGETNNEVTLEVIRYYKINLQKIISSKLDKSENKLLSRMSKSLKAARSMDGDCKQFQCGSVTKLELLKESFLEGFKGTFVAKRKTERNLSKTESSKPS